MRLTHPQPSAPTCPVPLRSRDSVSPLCPVGPLKHHRITLRGTDTPERTVQPPLRTCRPCRQTWEHPRPESAPPSPRPAPAARLAVPAPPPPPPPARQPQSRGSQALGISPTNTRGARPKPAPREPTCPRPRMQEPARPRALTLRRPGPPATGRTLQKSLRVGRDSGRRGAAVPAPHSRGHRPLGPLLAKDPRLGPLAQPPPLPTSRLRFGTPTVPPPCPRPHVEPHSHLLREGGRGCASQLGPAEAFRKQRGGGPSRVLDKAAPPGLGQAGPSLLGLVPRNFSRAESHSKSTSGAVTTHDTGYAVMGSPAGAGRWGQSP